MLKKILRIVLIVLIVLIVAAFAAPFLFKSKIISFAKEQINKHITAQVAFGDIDISFFRHFPRVSLGMQHLSVVGTGQFSKDTLLSAPQLDVAVNIMSLIGGGDMKIYAISLDQPRVHAIVAKDGSANWNITIPDTTSASTSAVSPKPFSLSLQHYSITDATIVYTDEPANMSSTIEHLNHSGSGDFTADQFVLSTKTNAKSVSFNYGGIPYLVDASSNIDADLQIDNKNDTYRFKTGDILVNNLKLGAEGFFRFVNDSTYDMDIKFNTPSNDFKSILSLIPSVYKKDFDKIKSGGTAAFNGFVKGEYSATKIPAYHVQVSVKNGFFQYPDLPKPVQNINIELLADNPDGITDNTVIDIQKAHFEMDNSPFDLRLLIKKPLTDRYVDGMAKGKLDLGKITQFVKLSAGTALSGMVNADITAKGNAAVLEGKSPGPFTASGFFDVSNLAYSASLFPQPITNTNFHLDVSNPDGVADHTVISIPAGHAEIGHEPLDFRILVKTPVSDLFFDGAAKGGFNLATIPQFVTLEPGTSISGRVQADLQFSGHKSAIDKKNYQAIAISGTYNLSDFLFSSKAYPDPVKLKIVTGNFNPKNITITNAAGNYKQSNFTASGSINNAIGYALKDEPLDGTLQVNADKINVNDWMGNAEPAAAPQPNKAGAPPTAPASAPFQVPKNISFVVNAAADKVHYDKLDISNLTGKLQVKNETVQMDDVQGQALGGQFGVSGSYSTLQNKSKPAIALNYDVKEIDVQQAFTAFNTLQKLMPVAQFLSGKMTSQMSLNGKLGEGMMPDLSTLTGKGALVVVEGFLKNFAPLDKLAQSVNVEALKDISLKGLKTYFEFANGKVLVKPFNFKVKDIDMQIGGIHGLDQSIDYLVGLKVPRAMLGTQGNALVNNLVSQVNSKGIPLKLGETVNFSVRIGGTMKSPVIKTDLKEAVGSATGDLQQQAVNFAKAKADSAKIAVVSAVKDSANSAKKQLLNSAKTALEKQLAGKKDTATAQPATDPRKKLEETGKGLLNNFLKKKKPADTTTNLH